jgi:hypothetical protein
VKVKHANLPLPEIEMIVGTRAALGMGLGFLLADKLSQPDTETARLGFVSVRNAHHNSLALRRFQAVEHADNRAGKR